MLLEWAAQVPPAFRFVLKASRRITHINRLSGADDSLAYFLRTVNCLGDRLGPTLFQCPPSLRKNVELLRDFLGRVPRTWRAAMEFRHDSWFDDEVYQALRPMTSPSWEWMRTSRPRRWCPPRHGDTCGSARRSTPRRS